MLLSCNKQEEIPKETTKIDTTAKIPSPEGMLYYGLSPCADCPGIETTIYFDYNGNARIEMVYQERDVAPLLETGLWSQKGDLVTVKTFDNEFYYKINNEQIESVSEKGEVLDSINRNFYIFKRINPMEASKLNGLYKQFSPKNSNPLEIHLNYFGGNQIGVKINSSNNNKSCSFKTQGSYENNRILIKLNDYDKNLNSIMVISINDIYLNLYTLNEDDAKDLTKVCKNVKTVMGRYKKIFSE